MPAPGLGHEAYTAMIEPGASDDGEDGLKIKAVYVVSRHLRLAGVLEFEREAGAAQPAEVGLIEALGQFGGIDDAKHQAPGTGPA